MNDVNKTVLVLLNLAIIKLLNLANILPCTPHDRSLADAALADAATASAASFSAGASSVPGFILTNFTSFGPTSTSTNSREPKRWTRLLKPSWTTLMANPYASC